MKKQTFFNAHQFDIEQIAAELYNLTKLGGISIPSFLTNKGKNLLLKEAQSMLHQFKSAPLKEGKVMQEMKTLYTGEGEPHASSVELPLLDSLVIEYFPFYRSLAQRVHFQQGAALNSRGYHHYPAHSIGISPHQDYSSDINLISIFVLKGNAPFYLCKDREKNDSHQLCSEPSSLILLRAPRSETEKPFRPFHYREPAEEERYTLLLRQRRYIGAPPNNLLKS